MEVMERKEVVATFSYEAAEQLYSSLGLAIEKAAFDISAKMYDDICIALPPCKLEVKAPRGVL